MIDTELTGPRNGDTVVATESTLRATVTGGDGNTLRVVKNGEILEEVAVSGDPFVYEFDTQAPSVGEDRYRHELADAAALLLTVTSYVWIQRPENPVSTPTATVTAAATPTATLPVADECVGDCDENDRVDINELITGVNILLGAADITRCPSFDRNDSSGVEINELITAVNASLNDCG
jgi:hypothetical protein